MTKTALMRLYVFLLVLLISIVSFSFRTTKNDGELNRVTSGDTTAFTANTTAGWIRHTCYLENIADSVEFEFILFRTVPPDNHWESSSELGTLRSDFVPSDERIFEYSELPRRWKIIIQTDGKCFFQLLSGPAPSGENIVLPVITKYKK
jgi:hypothetical protein